jgi:hypothetical protein
MNDTIVIFDRIRENLKIMRREPGIADEQERERGPEPDDHERRLTFLT